MTKNKIFNNAWNIIDEVAEEQTKERFELDDILYDISMKIFDYRIGKGWTQKQLAEKLDIKQAMVSKLESGEYNPTVEQLWKISKKLGWSFDIILDDKKEVQTNVWDNINEDYNELMTKKLVVGS
jgi:transcriptional regulator with XRE-family HTH domain